MKPGTLAAVALAFIAACGACGACGATSATSITPGDGHHGAIEHTKFHSDALGVDKHVVVYVPAGYADAANAAKHYPVFYYLHGLAGDETDWLEGGHIGEAADALALQAIIVMPDGDDSFYVDSVTPIDYDACMSQGSGLFMPERSRSRTCVHTASYEQYMTRDLIAWTDTTYRTITSRDGRAIAGLSMGGYGALMLSLRHPDLFSAAASHSGVVSLFYAGPHPYVHDQAKLVGDPKLVREAEGPIGEWMYAKFGPDIANWRAHDPATLMQQMPPGQVALYLDCGTEDIFQLDAAASYADDILKSRGIDHAFYIGPGDHTFKFWRPRLPNSLTFLRDHTTSAK